MNQERATGRMVMTVLEAHVEPERWLELEQVYSAASARLPMQLVQTFLVQDISDPSLWRVITLWQNRAALEEYRRSVETPGGVLMLRAVGAEPELVILDVVAALPPTD